MSFIKFLRGIGDRLGILESVSSSAATPTARIQTRIVTLRELAIEIKSAEVRALADSPAELAIPFEKIFETAGISSNSEDWTIDRLKRLIASEPLKNKPREEVQRAVLDRLHSEGVSAEKIVKDAIARDQALDSFETYASGKMQSRMDTCKRRLLEIESQMKDLQEESARLGEKLKMDEKSWREWKVHKRAQERELAFITSFIIDHPVISTAEEDAG
jgi:hypothetical protein